MAFSREMTPMTLGIGIEAKIQKRMDEMGKIRKSLPDSITWSIRHNERDFFEYFLCQEDAIKKCLDNTDISKEIVQKNAWWALKSIVEKSPDQASMKILPKVIVRNNMSMIQLLIEKWGEAYKQMPNFKDRLFMSLCNMEGTTKRVKPPTIEALEYFFSQEEIREILEERNQWIEIAEKL